MLKLQRVATNLSGLAGQCFENGNLGNTFREGKKSVQRTSSTAAIKAILEEKFANVKSLSFPCFHTVQVLVSAV